MLHHLTIVTGQEGPQFRCTANEGSSLAGDHIFVLPFVHLLSLFEADIQVLALDQGQACAVQNLLGGDHTTKFGVRYRNTPNSTFAYYPGSAEVRISSRGYDTLNPGPRVDSQGRIRGIGSTCDTCPLTADRARLYRPHNTQNGLYTYGAYLQDNYTKGKLRLNLGLRFDYQADEASLIWYYVMVVLATLTKAHALSSRLSRCW